MQSRLFINFFWFDNIPVCAKKNKATEVKRSVMADMRRLELLCLKFKKLHPIASDTSDMLSRQNFSLLMQAIESYTKSQLHIKAGLKTALYYLLKKLQKL